jgi:hypothetical protein
MQRRAEKTREQVNSLAAIVLVGVASTIQASVTWLVQHCTRAMCSIDPSSHPPSPKHPPPAAVLCLE